MPKLKPESDLEYFAGGVPAYAIYHLNMEGVLAVLSANAVSFRNASEELSLIGAVAYTEAFFKDHFASLLNILPKKIAGLRDGKRDISLDPLDLLELEDPLTAKFGFLLSQRYDFGTPRSINALYWAAFNVTPFGKEEVQAFGEILGTRNLLVHHGGIYTPQYLKGLHISEKQRSFMDSVIVDKKTAREAAVFLIRMAAKTAKATASKLDSELQEVDAMYEGDRKLTNLLLFEIDESDVLVQRFLEL